MFCVIMTLLLFDLAEFFADNLNLDALLLSGCYIVREI